MKIVTILQTYNEQRFIGGCLDHLAAHGISVYLVDNESTDETVAIAERRLTQNLIGIESLPRQGNFSLRTQLARKEQLAQSLDADWFMHLDTDELRVTPYPRCSLAQAIAQVDEAGFNAINFLEFTFVPTREHPDHDHPDFARTMRSYYPFLPQFPYRLNAWKRQDQPIYLCASGGHRVDFPGLRMAPWSLYSRHYLFLSLAHLATKFSAKRYAPDEVAAGWHRIRSRVDPTRIELPSESDLRTYVADHLLDASNPRTREVIDPSSYEPMWRQYSGLFKRAVRGAKWRARALKRTTPPRTATRSQ